MTEFDGSFQGKTNHERAELFDKLVKKYLQDELFGKLIKRYLHLPVEEGGIIVVTLREDINFFLAMEEISKLVKKLCRDFQKLPKARP